MQARRDDRRDCAGITLSQCPHRPRRRPGADRVSAASTPGASLPAARARHLRQRTVPRARLAVQGMTQTGAATYGTDEEWTLVIQRVKGIPLTCSRPRAADRRGHGQQHTRRPDDPPRRYQHVGGQREYFAETLPKLGADRISGAQHDRLVADLRQASQDASSAYRAMRDFVADTYFESRDAKTLKPAFASDHFAMGAEEYTGRFGTTCARR